MSEENLGLDDVDFLVWTTVEDWYPDCCSRVVESIDNGPTACAYM
jgi:hypothetical protein